MSQRIIYDILKNDLNGAGTRQDIINILVEKYPEVSTKTVTDKLTRMRKWGCVGYRTARKSWFISGEFDYSINRQI